MTLVCIQPFGNFEPGDRVEVPEGAIFDTAYFRRDETQDEGEQQ